MQDSYLQLSSAAGDADTTPTAAPTASASITSDSIDSTINVTGENSQLKPCYPTITMNIQDYK